jgi:glycosyltransferase involved in cell wall biosynthesis
MPAYVMKICSSIPALMPDVTFYFLINKAFEHNDDKENYTPSLETLSQFENVIFKNIDSEDERSWELFKLPQFLRAEKIDLLHMPTNRVCMLTTISQVTTVHDCMEWKYLERNHGTPPNSNLKARFYHWRKRLYAQLNYLYGVKYKAKYIITVSNYAKRSISSIFHVNSERITVCRHGLPDGFSDKEGAPLKDRNGILMLGGDSYQKNCKNAIKAYSMLPPEIRKRHKLTICGFHQNKNSPLLKAIESYGVSEDVIVHAWVSTEDLQSYFSNSRAFLFVSREEGFGFPLLQALHLGTPTVISNADVLREIAGETYPCAAAENPEQMSHLLKSYIEDDKLWESTSISSKEASRKFNWIDSINSHIQVYKNLLEG